MDAFLEWVRSERRADMAWLGRNLDIREDPSLLLPGCRTLITLAWPYSSRKPASPDGWTVSRYARPDRPDYHIELKARCRILAAEIERLFPESRNRICVDSAPILERSMAREAGLGFIGKNTMLIVPAVGSYVFLAEILTTAELPVSRPRTVESQCGDCTRCLDACPTGALEAPYRLNASKCLSYRTIEGKGDVGPRDGKRMGICFLGCDLCQEACPLNPGKGSRKVSLPPVRDFFVMDEAAFRRRFGHTALARPGLGKIRSNLEAVGEKGAAWTASPEGAGGRGPRED
jgi:epoxyqueuosine reductase